MLKRKANRGTGRSGGRAVRTRTGSHHPGREPRCPRGSMLPALLLLLTLSPAALRAQSLTYTTVTKAEFGGQLGTLIQMVPGALEETKETTYYKGSLIRTDRDQTSSIVDLGEGRYTFLEHEPKTYYTVSFEEMKKQMEAALAEAQAGAVERPEAEEPAEKPDVEFKLSVERTGRTQKVGGYEAEQVLIVLEMVPKAEEAPEEGEDSGSISALTALWISDAVPGYQELQQAQAKAAQEIWGGGGEGGMAAALEQAFASDPRMKEAFEKTAEEMKGLTGLPVKTVTTLVAVPIGQKLDREAVLAAMDQPISPGKGDVLAGAAKEGAKEAARQAVRGLTRGLFGGKKEEPKEPEKAESQVILLRTTSLIQDISTDDLSDDLFRPPPDYTERKPDWAGGTGGS